MLQLFDTYASLFKSWQVICYEQEGDGTLRRRWDNAPHWPGVATAPHHVHLPGQETPEPSNVTDLEDLLRFIQN